MSSFFTCIHLPWIHNIFINQHTFIESLLLASPTVVSRWLPSPSVTVPKGFSLNFSTQEHTRERELNQWLFSYNF